MLSLNLSFATSIPDSDRHMAMLSGSSDRGTRSRSVAAGEGGSFLPFAFVVLVAVVVRASSIESDLVRSLLKNVPVRRGCLFRSSAFLRRLPLPLALAVAVDSSDGGTLSINRFLPVNRSGRDTISTS